MSDWADDEVAALVDAQALKLSDMDRSEWADRLRAACNAGRVKSMREAADMARQRGDSWGAASIRHECFEMQRLFAFRAKAIEQESV